MKKKYPDNIVYDYKLGKFDANTKSYPTNVGSQSFEPIKVDKSDSRKANNYFDTRLNELKSEYNKLVEEYNWTRLVYKSDYSFQPLIGQEYYLYEKPNKELFLSLIGPKEWDKLHVGTFRLLTNGKWEKL
tara:strand:- start:15693 stop:16082 length:390 start_codon:yes stop_codon:yes gene_type:complete